MGERAGARISRQAFLQSAAILLALMVGAGLLTRVLPAGAYERALVDGRPVIVPGSYAAIEAPHYPIWRWFTAPAEVLFVEGNLTVIVILAFILFVGAAFAVLHRVGILQAMVANLVQRFEGRKYALLLIITFVFMLLGATFGVFEEIVPLIPLMVALALSLGWDSLVGLGMSVLATNMGFSAAIANPFTIGVAQEIAGLPLFSGLWLRLLAFLATYGLLAWFLVGYARRVEQDPARSPVAEFDRQQRHGSGDEAGWGKAPPHLARATRWFALFLVLILLALVAAPFVPPLSGYALPLVGILFLAGGLGAGIISGAGVQPTLRAAAEGTGGIAPGIPLILMAVSIRHIVAAGGILDTILHYASRPFVGTAPMIAVAAVLLITLVLELFVASGSAKAFLLMPILVPLADLVGVTRQTMVLTYAFGDGFSNMVYPTNPVLLISLGFTVVSYPIWIRWSARLWLGVLALSLAFLAVAAAVGYGPF